MRQAETHGFHPICVARFLAISRVCLFVNFEDLATFCRKENRLRKRHAGPYFAAFLANKTTIGLQYPQNLSTSGRLFPSIV